MVGKQTAELRILFRVDKDCSTPAVPIDSNKTFCAIRAKGGNRTAFSGAQASASRPSVDGRSPSICLRIRHSHLSSSSDRQKILEISEKSAVSGMSRKTSCIDASFPTSSEKRLSM